LSNGILPAQKRGEIRILLKTGLAVGVEQCEGVPQMNSITRWILTRIAKRMAWNFPCNRELYQRQVLLAWYRIMHEALNDEVNDNSAHLRRMAVDAHELVWGKGA